MSDNRATRDDGLSEAGAARREEILGTLHARLDSRLRRRGMVRAGLGAAAVVGLAAIVWAALPSAPMHVRPLAEGPITHNAPERAEPVELPGRGVDTAPFATGRVTVRIVSTDSLDAAPCDGPPTAGVCLLSDEQLLAALAEAGQPSGLVRVGGRAVVVPREGQLGDGLN